MDRAALRRHLKAAREPWLTDHPEAPAALAGHLASVLAQLEPLCLGLYWPLPGEFDAPAFWRQHALTGVTVALPFAFREGRRMEFRRWDGQAPSQTDEMGISAPVGAGVEPDVVLVPCVGYRTDGYRLGYGGGYFDRWLAARPGVTAVGVAWQSAQVDFAVAPHDQALPIVVTDAGVLAP